MLNDADPNYFAGVYIVCGYTALGYGIDFLAAIIERKCHMDLFVPNTLFLFCGRATTKQKRLLGKGDGFLLLYKRVESGHFKWTRFSDELRSMSPEQFRWLIQGFAIAPIIHDIIPRYSAYFTKLFCTKLRTFPLFFYRFQGSVHSFQKPSHLCS